MRSLAPLRRDSRSPASRRRGEQIRFLQQQVAQSDTVPGRPQQPNRPVQAASDVPVPRGSAVVASACLEGGADVVPVTLLLGTAQRHFNVSIGASEQRRGQPVRTQPPPALALAAHAL